MSSAASPIPQDTLSPTDLRAWRGLVRAHACLVKRLDAQLEAEHGVPLSSYEVLNRLSEADGGKLRMHDIAASVLLSRSGLTRLVDRLERDGLVCRCSCENDARGAYAVITDTGRARLEEARATHRAGIRTLFAAHYTQDELELLAPLLERLLPADGCCSQT
jgi:DNA-binding MarR family transcriptional regulator